MRHVLIILSLLLLTSPLYSQSKETGVLYRWENGSKYMGEWKDGKKHGQGTFTYSRGKYVGEFRKGKQFNTTLYDKDGNIYGRYVNGVRQ